MSEPKNKEKARLQHTYLVKLIVFYKKAFSDTKEMQKSISLANEKGTSFMVVGVQCKHDVVVGSSFVTMPPKAMKIIVAITFSMSH